MIFSDEKKFLLKRYNILCCYCDLKVFTCILPKGLDNQIFFGLLHPEKMWSAVKIFYHILFPQIFLSCFQDEGDDLSGSCDTDDEGIEDDHDESQNQNDEDGKNQHRDEPGGNIRKSGTCDSLIQLCRWGDQNNTAEKQKSNYKS